MSRLRKFDYSLFLPTIFLLGLGIVTIASVSSSSLDSHLLYVFISFLFFFIFSFLDPEILFPLSPLIYVFCVLFLVLPFFVGTVTRGAVRWIPLGQFTIQPSEIVKPFLALISAWYWAKREVSLKTFLSFSLLFLPILVLIFFQPDLGSTLSVLSIFAGCLFSLRIKTKQVLVIIATILVALPLLWFSLRVKTKQVLVIIATILAALPLLWFSLQDYQKTRITHFIDPSSDPLGKGYNIIQAKIAVGSGGVWGRGLGRGTQSHLTFLPERNTDFVFASLAEETGFAGSLFVLVLYIFLFLRILKIAFHARENYPNGRLFYLLSMGLFFYLSFQVVVNVGMNVGLLPITGITLPLISYGGSSLLTTMISLGMLESVSIRSRQEETIMIK